jgi:hypothetical protein
VGSTHTSRPPRREPSWLRARCCECFVRCLARLKTLPVSGWRAGGWLEARGFDDEDGTRAGRRSSSHVGDGPQHHLSGLGAPSRQHGPQPVRPHGSAQRSAGLPGHLLPEAAGAPIQPPPQRWQEQRAATPWRSRTRSPCREAPKEATVARIQIKPVHLREPDWPAPRRCAWGAHLSEVGARARLGIQECLQRSGAHSRMGRGQRDRRRRSGPEALGL